MDAVFSLQRSGSSAVFAYQYPFGADVATTGGGADDWAGWRATQQIMDSNAFANRRDIVVILRLLAQLGVFE